MGLDVYLYKYDDKPVTEALEAEYQAEVEKIWFGKSYDRLSKEEQAELSERGYAVATRLGLGKYGSDEKLTHGIELPSAKHPDHFFKIGYFRSSYNAGGIDSVLESKIGTNLDQIMGAGDSYKFQPDWQVSRDRAEAALAAFNAAITKSPFRAFAVSIRSVGVSNEEGALAVFNEQMSKQVGFKSFSNRDGDFFLEGQQVFGLVSGRDILGFPCVYMVTKDDGLAWYSQALEIVIETCDFALTSPDIAKLWLHWSG